MIQKGPINQWLRIVWLFSGLILSNGIIAQSVTFQLGNQRFMIPEFRAETATGYHNDFVRMGIVPQINQSRAEVEIRVYRWNQRRLRDLMYGEVSVITCEEGQVSVSGYTGRGELPADLIDTQMQSVGWRPVTGDEDKRYYEFVTQNDPMVKPDSLLYALIGDSLFVLGDEKGLIDSLQSLEPPATVAQDKRRQMEICSYCLPHDTLLVEIKIGDKIRSFGMEALQGIEPASLEARLAPYDRLRDLLFITLPKAKSLN